MNRQYRLLKIASLYSLAMAEKDGWWYITEGDIYGILKNVPNVMMTPGSYRVDISTGNVVQPWGPTVTFDYTYSGPRPKGETWAGSGQGDSKAIKTVESAVTSKFNLAFGQYIQNIATKYNGNWSYTVTITQKP